MFFSSAEYFWLQFYDAFVQQYRNMYLDHNWLGLTTLVHYTRNQVSEYLKLPNLAEAYVQIRSFCPRRIIFHSNAAHIASISPIVVERLRIIHKMLLIQYGDGKEVTKGDNKKIKTIKNICTTLDEMISFLVPHYFDVLRHEWIFCGDLFISNRKS